MSNGNGLKTGIAAVIGTAMLVVTPTTSSASSQEGWDICPAIDTQPICEIVHPRNQPGSDGTAVTNRPTTDDATTIWTGDTKDHPDFGPVNRVDRAPISDCLPPDRSLTSGDVAACSHHRPDDENATGTAELIDVP
jgi:hypothetical protein